VGGFSLELFGERGIPKIWQGRIHGMIVEACLGMLIMNLEDYPFQFPVVLVVDYISLFQSLLPVELFLCGVQLSF
jgi:hypothetical protein